MSSETQPSGSRNAWRLETPGPPDWPHSARTGATNKYFMVSADSHACEPPKYMAERIEPEYRDRLPRVETWEDGSRFIVTEGGRPQLVSPGRNWKNKTQVPEQQSFEKSTMAMPHSSRMEEEDLLRSQAGAGIENRDRDNAADGIDAEIIFANKGLLCYATPDPVFAMAMCRAWNRWALEEFGAAFERMLPMAMVCPGDLAGTMTEIEWAAEQGFKGLLLPNKPIYGPTQPDDLMYNDPSFERLWSQIVELGLPITLHVSTGRDPRAASGNGGAIINYLSNSMQTTIDPLVQIISSGVLERHPGLRVGTVESGIGWLPWMLETMDHAYRAHHMWVRPALPRLPSEYYRSNCFSTFQIDPAGLDLIEERDLVDNVMWANDYPHQEGTWPHSAAAIERSMGSLREDTREKVLGLNAARVFGIEVPAETR
ncbi:MAG: amidohydrolase family protein [Myxococcota bacterium]